MGLRHDAATGWIVHRYRDRDVFLKSRHNRWHPRYADASAREVYYPYYRPRSGDTVVDIGAGFGYEAVYLATRQPDLTWIGVEIQPSVFECLSLTLAGLGTDYRAYPLPLSDGPELSITPTVVSSDATTVGGRSVTLPTTSVPDFMRRHALDRIDFLKMNVEGAEADILAAFDLSRVDEVAISCHDFLAERGLDERFRTFERVDRILRENGFDIRRGSGPQPARAYWIYGSRNNFRRDDP